MYFFMGLLFFQMYYLFYVKDFKSIFGMMLIWFFIMFFLSNMEYFHITPLVEDYSMDSGVVSTFGNANYLAGYMLIIVPLFFYFMSNYYMMVAFLMLTFLLLLLTKSMVAMWLFLAYLLLLLLLSFKDFMYSYKYRFGIMLFMMMSSFMFIFKYNYHIFKVSLETSLYLWTTFMDMYFNSIKNLFFGYWLDTLHLMFDYFKPVELYSKYKADSFHNFFMDWFYWFWMFGIYFVYLFWFFIKSFWETYLAHVLMLFVLFFSLNIYTISHLLMVVFVIVYLFKYETS